MTTATAVAIRAVVSSQWVFGWSSVMSPSQLLRRYSTACRLNRPAVSSMSLDQIASLSFHATRSEQRLSTASGHNRPMDDNVPDDPLYAEALAEFARLFEEAGAAGEPDRTAMTVATATLDARPAARTVLLKAFDPRGFVFYTHMDGRKGRELQANPYAALLFHWPRVRQGVQVRIEGRVHTLPDD